MVDQFAAAVAATPRRGVAPFGGPGQFRTLSEPLVSSFGVTLSPPLICIGFCLYFRATMTVGDRGPHCRVNSEDVNECRRLRSGTTRQQQRPRGQREREREREVCGAPPTCTRCRDHDRIVPARRLRRHFVNPITLLARRTTGRDCQTADDGTRPDSGPAQKHTIFDVGAETSVGSALCLRHSFTPR